MSLKGATDQAEAKLAPWVGNPCGLVSLYDLLKRYAETFYQMGTAVSVFLTTLDSEYQERVARVAIAGDTDDSVF